MIKPNFFLITGGPGVGKTALLAELRRRGERVVEETHRRVIREQVASGGTALPWIDQDAYLARAAREDIAIFDGMEDVRERVFFDRGILDSMIDGRAPDWMEAAARTHRYSRTVFVPPPWREIYTQDDERKQSLGLPGHARGHTPPASRTVLRGGDSPGGKSGRTRRVRAEPGPGAPRLKRRGDGAPAGRRSCEQLNLFESA